MSNVQLDAGALLRRLHDAGIDYVVVGGLAVIAHGVQRFTNDLDICPAPDPANLERLASMLQRADSRQLGLGDFDVEALSTLLDAARAGGAVRDDVDAEDVLLAIGGIWAMPVEPGWEERARRLLGLVMDGLRYKG